METLTKRMRQTEIAEKIDEALWNWYFERGMEVPNWKMQKDPQWWVDYLISLDENTQILYNTHIYVLIMDYKPYSVEWTRRRYLAEAIQQYFDDNVSVDTVLDDIVSVLEENATEHKSRAERFQEVLDGLKALPY